MRKVLKYKYLVYLFFVFQGCSTLKNTTTTRAYHNLISHYNIYFNGLESFRKGVRKAQNEKTDNYALILPLFLYSDKNISQSVSPDMDRAAKKATTVITLHSITAKPDLKKGLQTQRQKDFFTQREFNKWMDENYLLLGKSYVYRNEFDLAIETFKHVISDFSHTPSRYDALIWLARCFIETDEFREALRILDLLESDVKLPARLKEEFYVTYADYYLRQKNYEKTIPMLQRALEDTRKKFYKVRYTFILAQIFQETGNLEQAAENYKKVIKLNPPYEMTFNAKISLAGSFSANKGEGKELKALLRKMLKDDKNKEFQDQIYYALGKIAQKENNTEEALEFFKQSTSKSTKNQVQKGLTYLTMGDLYYNRQDYTEAKLYYDSTIQNIDPDFENYNSLSKKAVSLTNLVNNLTVYELEDSVQILAKMTDAERRGIIDIIISEVIQKEQEELKKSQVESMDQQFGLMNQAAYNPRNTGEKVGKWYFYNTNAKSFGQPEFRMIWGNRKLEDNWRRKNKQTIEDFDPDELKETAEEDVETVSGKVSGNKSHDFYLKNIPLTEESLTKSHEKLKEALYNMGLIYDEELSDFDKAIESLMELVKRYPDDRLAMLSYYKLYTIHSRNGDTPIAQEYKNLIVSKFPDSPIAQILTNPEYARQLKEKENLVNIQYEEAYARYNTGDYQGVIEDIERIMAISPENIQAPRFLLLKALSAGQLYGAEKMKAELEGIVHEYPQHEAGIYARELIDYIYIQAPEIKTADLQQVAEQIYTFNPAEMHYLMISASRKADINQLNFNLINFNLDNFNNLNLAISTEESGDLNLIMISSFSEMNKAHSYMDSLLKSGEVFKGFDRKDFIILLISDSNLKKLLEDNDIGKYYLYFEKYY